MHADEPFLFRTIQLPSSACTVRRSLNCSVPSFFALMIGCLKVWLAVPPMWNVRIVNCVPGSPIDCAAIMPTASPSFTNCPVARLRP